MIEMQHGEAVSAFLKELTPVAAAYPDPDLRIVALQFRGEWRILRAQLILEPLLQEIQPRQTSSPSVLIGHWRLSALGMNLSDFLIACTTGRIETPIGEMRHEGYPHAYFESFAKAGDQQARSLRLTFAGPVPLVETDEIAWALRAHSPPYHDLHELMADYGLGPVPDTGAVIEITAMSPIWVDYSSPVHGSAAAPTFRISKFLEPGSISLGFRVMTGVGQPITRSNMNGADISWVPDPDLPGMLLGQAKLEVPEEAVVACYISYRGRSYHYGFVQDRENIANPNRAVIEAFDRRLSRTRELLKGEAEKKHQQKNDLEDAVATVLWLLGFAVSQLGRNKLTEDAPDLIARSPNGNFLIVEVTAGVLKDGHKLANLVNRSAQVRRRLNQSWHRSAKVQPVIVTSLSRDQVALEMAQAEMDGIKVFTREDLDVVIDQRTEFPSDANAMFAEIEEYLRMKADERAREASEPSLPGTIA